MEERPISRAPWNWGAKALALATVVAATGCGGGGGGTGTGGGGGGGTSNQGQLAKNTLLVDKSGASQVVSQNGSSITFRGQRNDIKPGSVVFNTNGTGSIRKVKAVSFSGGNTVAVTEDGGLVDAVETLKTKTALPFSREAIGEIKSKDPAVSFTWVKGDPIKSRDVSYNVLEINFKDFSLGLSKGIDIDGTATFQAEPQFDLNMDREPGKLLPSVSYMKAGMSARLGGSLSVTSKYGGSVAATKTVFDEYVGPPQVYGWLVFRTRLKVEAGIEGTASGGVTHTESLGLTADVSETYVRNTGWSTAKSLTPSYQASEADVDAEFSLRLRPLVVTLAYELYGVAGPYASLESYAEAVGTHTVQNGEEGIEAVVNKGLNGLIGLVAELPAGLETMFGGTWKPFDFTFEVTKTELFRKFFPFTGTSSISVGDNGPAPDDIFSVSLDGTLLGQTDKGGTGAFRVTSLRPGQHTLTVTCLDDGANGNDAGTLGLSLANGFTFLDGGTTVSDVLALGESKDYTVVVPDTGKPWIKPKPLPKSRLAQEHPRR
ncbi:MAG: hypothetical protein JST30_16865 [Armatimonadetes bacterium]|nr:hypothetical protein [Armatimonadota bacterium]